MMSNVFIHPTAIIDEGARIGEGTKIWHFCHLMPCTVGAGCILGQNVYIDRNVTIGNGVKIQNNVSVYQGVEVEDDVFIGPSVVFTNVINPRSFMERKDEFRKTLIGRGATLGANSTIICGVRVGAFALVGAGAVVTRDVPPFALVFGNPAEQRGWVSRAAYNLIFNDKGEARCPVTGENYLLKGGEVIIS